MSFRNCGELGRRAPGLDVDERDVKVFFGENLSFQDGGCEVIEVVGRKNHIPTQTLAMLKKRRGDKMSIDKTTGDDS